MNFNWNKKKRLKSAGITLTHHHKLKKLIMIIEKLISQCERTINTRNKIYKVYFNNQASLKVIHVMSLIFDQKRLQRIQMTTNKICNYDVHLKFYWIFNHANIENNEITDKVTKKAHNFVLFSLKRLCYEVTTRVNFIRVLSRRIWNKKWKKKMKKVQYRKLTSKVNHRHLNIHVERSKTHSTLII